jgi:hypothetical protein
VGLEVLCEESSSRKYHDVHGGWTGYFVLLFSCPVLGLSLYYETTGCDGEKVKVQNKITLTFKNLKDGSLLATPAVLLASRVHRSVNRRRKESTSCVWRQSKRRRLLLPSKIFRMCESQISFFSERPKNRPQSS